jgi:prephenate dehydratase
VHFLLPATGLFIVGEYFFGVHHQLWGLPESELKKVRKAMSHPQALAQCSKFLNRHRLAPTASSDTALSCRLVRDLADPTCAAIASEAAGALYGLKRLAENIENSADNTTRFLLMSRHPLDRGLYVGRLCKTSLIFKVKNIHSALFQALKCFADEALNLSKIESYMCDGRFTSAQFYIEVQSSDQDAAFQRALAALEKVCQSIHLLGTYPENSADVSVNPR